MPHAKQQQNLDNFPHLKRWFNSIASRPAVIKAYEQGEEISNQPTVTEESKKILFGQSAESIKGNN